MPASRPPARSPAEGGFVMIEVLVSALVILIVAGAVTSLMTATTRSAADQRAKQGAYAAAQEDQARLRTMRLSSLNRLSQTRAVAVDGTTYTVKSTGTFVNNSTGNDSSCTSEGSATDYVRIRSTVTWSGSRTPVVVNSIVSPSNGSLDPNHGTLLITATNGQLKPLSGLGISATGAGTFSGSTDSTGCANFSDLPAGNYTVTTTATGFVNKDGQFSPWTTSPVGVVASASTPVSFMYDLPGKIIAKFKYRVGSTSEFKPATADSIIAYNAGMTKAATFGTPGGTRSAELKAEPLFPFKEADAVYAGSCEINKPEKTEAIGAVIVPANGTITTPEIQLPALNLKVLNGTAAFSGARITVTDTTCKNSSNELVKRVYTSNSSGAMSATGGTSASEPGLPWGTYNICISGTISSKLRKRTYEKISVKDLKEGTKLESNLATGEETTKACP